MKSRNFASKRLVKREKEDMFSFGNILFSKWCQKEPKKIQNMSKRGGKGAKGGVGEYIADGGKLQNSSGSFVIFSTEG